MYNSVYAAYRLQPRDLNGPYAAAIRRVTYEGVEALRPVLHFEGVAKPLVLSAEQGRTLMRLTGENLCERWVGHRVMLSPGEENIALAEPGDVRMPRGAVRASTSLPQLLSALSAHGGNVDARPTG